MHAVRRSHIFIFCVVCACCYKSNKNCDHAYSGRKSRRKGVNIIPTHFSARKCVSLFVCGLATISATAPARAGTGGCASTPPRPGCMMHAAAVVAGGAREHLPLDQDYPHPPAPGPRPGCLNPAPARGPGIGSLPGLEFSWRATRRCQLGLCRPNPAAAWFDSRSPRSSVAAQNVPRQGLLPRGGRE